MKKRTLVVRRETIRSLATRTLARVAAGVVAEAAEQSGKKVCTSELAAAPAATVDCAAG